VRSSIITGFGEEFEMKKFVFLVLIGFAAWQAWKHYPSLFQRRDANEAVVENTSHRGIVKLRLTIGDQTFVSETLDNGKTARFPFRVSHDSSLQMVWEWKDAVEEHSWRGADVTAGPELRRYVITIVEGGDVVSRVEQK
jgi:hypothetical protein